MEQYLDIKGVKLVVDGYKSETTNLTSKLDLKADKTALDTKANKTDIPTKTSLLTNDSDFITKTVADNTGSTGFSVN